MADDPQAVTDGWRAFRHVRVIPAGSLDTNTAQTPGMNRAAAIQHRPRRHPEDLGRHRTFIRTPRPSPPSWAAGERDPRHPRQGARMRWGEQLEFVAEAGPGDFIYVPPFVPHQEINASADETLECRAGAQRQRGPGREPRHRAGGEAGVGRLDRSDPQGVAEAENPRSRPRSRASEITTSAAASNGSDRFLNPSLASAAVWAAACRRPPRRVVEQGRHRRSQLRAVASLLQELRRDHPVGGDVERREEPGPDDRPRDKGRGRMAAISDHHRATGDGKFGRRRFRLRASATVAARMASSLSRSPSTT